MNRAMRRANAKDAIHRANTQTAKALLSGKQHRLSRQLLDGESSADFVHYCQSVVAKFGQPPMDCNITSAHEAGHVIVGQALGGKFLELWVKETHPGIWEGYNAVELPGSPKVPTKFRMDQNPKRAFLLTVLYVAGFAAETIIGRCHAASSVDEMFHAKVFAHSMGFVTNAPTVEILRSVIGTAGGLILANKDAFHSLRTLLEEKHFVTAEEIASLNIQRVDADDLAAGWADTFGILH